MDTTTAERLKEKMNNFIFTEKTASLLKEALSSKLLLRAAGAASEKAHKAKMGVIGNPGVGLAIERLKGLKVRESLKTTPMAGLQKEKAGLETLHKKRVGQDQLFREGAAVRQLMEDHAKGIRRSSGQLY